MKPFLFLGTRAEDDAADDEYAAVLRCAGLDEPDLRRVRLERDSLADALGTVDLDDWSGIVLGGGPFNSSDPEDSKSADAAARRGRAARAGRGRSSRPTCRSSAPATASASSVGTAAASSTGRTASRSAASTITLTDGGRARPAARATPAAVQRLPRPQGGGPRAAAPAPCCLAASPTCPVQAFRMGSNVYATQFHPELDVEGLFTRIEVYRDHGYFRPGEGERAVRTWPAPQRRHRARPDPGRLRREVRP